MGTSSYGHRYVTCTQDHPHAYGDKLRSSYIAPHSNGSSPRVWGQASNQCFRSSAQRIIPTRMGTSSIGRRCSGGREDHPHAYGDKSILYVIRLVSLGSSPRVWGQVFAARGEPKFSRIIPTRMGTRAIAPDNALGCKDHPHAYGDKLTVYPCHSLKVGSSPRVWGQVYRNMTLHAWRRIIPTRMGTRLSTALTGRSSWDHPHAYGDKISLR